ncbi:MAG: hypothetical protein ACPGVG_06150 [Mycobacterium sp.]
MPEAWVPTDGRPVNPEDDPNGPFREYWPPWKQNQDPVGYQDWIQRKADARDRYERQQEEYRQWLLERREAHLAEQQRLRDEEEAQQRGGGDDDQEEAEEDKREGYLQVVTPDYHNSADFPELADPSEGGRGGGGVIVVGVGAPKLGVKPTLPGSLFGRAGRLHGIGSPDEDWGDFGAFNGSLG